MSLFFRCNFLFWLFFYSLLIFVLLFWSFIKSKFLLFFKRLLNCLGWLLSYFPFKMVWIFHSLSTLRSCIHPSMLKWLYYYCFSQHLKFFLFAMNDLIWFFTCVVVSTCIIKSRRGDRWIFYFWLESRNFAHFSFLLLPFLC